jgi:HEAT repeat protein
MRDVMIGRVRVATALLAIWCAPALAGAQSGSAIARRVAAAPDGEVRMTFASRSDACGDGRDVVAISQSFFASTNIESYGRWSGVTCRPGPARVALTVRDREVVGVRSHVGGSWRTDASAVDLGQVPATEAAAYLMSLAPKVTGRRSNPLLAAALADSVHLAPDMLRLARTATLPRETRRRAVNWAGILGDASTVAPLLQLAREESNGARDDRDDVGPGDGLQGAAAGALSMIPEGAGMPALIELARRGPATARRSALFWLGQRDDPQGRAVVRAIATDDKESEQLRGAAIFALGQSDRSSTSDGGFLRELFPRLTSEKLKDRLLMAVSQGDSPDGARWLLAQARDERQPIEVRRKAVFWAGQGQAKVADIVSLYREAREARFREHVIFVLSQRDEESAIDALIAIARSDADKAMRGKALFWLGQKDDPRVTKLISELVSR